MISHLDPALVKGSRRQLSGYQAVKFRWQVEGGIATIILAGVTKTMLHQEWSMTIEQSIEAEAQALCMLTQDFKRAYEAFVDRCKPTFEGN